MAAAKSLLDRTIALPETRELDLLAGMVSDLGGRAYRCPFVAIEDTSDVAHVEAWLERLVSGGFHDVVLFTGEGLTRLLGFAERAGMHAAVLEALRQVRIISRGPKPGRALKVVGLRADVMADAPTTDGVVTTLAREPLEGRRIGVQLYGEEPNEKLIAFLKERGAEVHPVWPYVYVPGADEPIIELIGKMAAGAIDAIAFTSSSQVHRLWEVAETRRLGSVLATGLARTRVAAVGPIVAATLQSKGARVDAVPERSFFLRPLVTELSAILCPAHTSASDDPEALAAAR